MEYQMKITCLAGSIRASSFNNVAVKSFAFIAEEAGHECDIIDLSDYPLPLFNQDEEEESIIAIAQKLADRLNNSDAVFISSPEYNGSVSPLLKNTLDWMSRTPNKPYQNKIFAIGAASPGALGGIRGLAHLRDILTSVGAIVIPKMLTIGGIQNLMDEQGLAVQERQKNQVESMLDSIEKLL